MKGKNGYLKERIYEEEERDLRKLEFEKKKYERILFGFFSLFQFLVISPFKKKNVLNFILVYFKK